jgi:hypothetical protein
MKLWPIRANSDARLVTRLARRIAANIAKLPELLRRKRLTASGAGNNYRTGFGFHARASLCASAICGGVIFSAMVSRSSCASQGDTALKYHLAPTVHEDTARAV